MESKADMARRKFLESLVAFSNENVVLGRYNKPKLVWVGWKRSSKGWMKLNTNGCMQRETIRAGADGVLRNDEGGWVHGYSLNLGIYLIEEVESLVFCPWNEAVMGNWLETYPS